MSDFPPLVPPYTRVPLVHDSTDLFDPETMDALDARYTAAGGAVPVGGATGELLTKDSGTDYDVSWQPAPVSGISPTIVDAKGDLIAATANDTPARVAVGSNGQVLTADSTQTPGVKWATLSIPAAITPPPFPVATVMNTGEWFCAFASTSASFGFNPSAGYTYGHRFCPSLSFTADRVAIQVTVVGSGTRLIRLGLYADTDGGRTPGALIADWGTVTCGTLGAREITISQAFTAGTIYWLAYCDEGTGTIPQIRGINPNLHPRFTTSQAEAFDPAGRYGAEKSGSGALSNPAAMTTYGGGNIASIVFRRA